MATTIKLKNGSGAPLAADLVQGEPAFDLTNKRLYTENASGTVIEIGTSPSTIDINAGTIDGTVIGGASAAAGTFTTLNATGGGALTGTWSDLGSVTTVDINGGTIDGVTIGGASAGAGTFTTIAGTQFSSDATDVELKYSGSTKLSTTTTGIDVTGTVTADGLTVDGSVNVNGTVGDIFKIATTAGNADLWLTDTDTSAGQVRVRGDANSLKFITDTKVRHTIANNGDISFYEDTGTTPKLFWDASAEALGLGTVSPAAKLQINSGDIRIVQTDNSSNNGLYFRNSADSGTYAKVAYVAATGELQVGTTDAYSLLLQTNNTTKATLDSSGNLGLGVTPSAWGTAAGFKAFQLPGGNVNSFSTTWLITAQNAFSDSSGIRTYVNNGFASEYIQTSGEHRWLTAPSGTAGNTITFTQAMTLDADGDLGVGTTNPLYRLHINSGTVNSVAVFESTDATAIIGFKDNSTTNIPSIGAVADAMIFNTGAAERMRIDSSGNLDMTAAGSGNIKIKNGNGIDFSASAGGGATSSILDDYEEGTWDVTNASDATGTVGTVSGYYTKVGRMVTVYGVLQVTANFTSSSLAGLPFAPVLESGALTSIVNAFVISNQNRNLFGRLAAPTGNIGISASLDGSSTTLTTTDDILRFSFTYQTS